MGTAKPEPLGVMVQGSGPILVAVHGGLLGGRLTFDGVASTWAESYTVIVVDRPGFERTGGEGEIGIGNQADRILATIEAHGEGNPVHAVGVGVGGLVLLRVLQQQPRVMTTITLVETPAVDLCASDMVEPARLVKLMQQAHQDLPDDPAAADGVHAEIDPQLWMAVGPMLERGDPGVTSLRTDLDLSGAMLDRSKLANATSGEQPVGVLCVSGSRSSVAFRIFGASTAAALSGRHAVITGAGHMAHLHPDFRALLDDHTGLS